MKADAVDVCRVGRGKFQKLLCPEGQMNCLGKVLLGGLQDEETMRTCYFS